MGIRVMVNQYRRGSRFELQVKKMFEARGYYVMKSAGSRGIADLIALDKVSAQECGPHILIQCKLDGVMSEKEKSELVQLAILTHTTAMLVYKADGEIIEDIL
jgi:Holliday junction resolvase